MKKVALSLLALALVGTGAFADATADVVKSPVTASFEVNGSASIGADLDTGVHGFSNGVTSKLTLWFINGSSEKTGEGDVHGYIKVADVKFGFDGATNANAPTLAIGDVTAKIVAGDLYVKLYTNSDASVGYTLDGDDDSAYVLGGPEKKTAKYGATGTEWVLGDTTSYSLLSSKGIEVGYLIPEVVELTGVVGSNQDWSVPTQSNYEGSFAASLKAVKDLTLAGKFLAAGVGSEVQTAFGGEFAYNLGVAEPFAHANFNGKTSKYDADFGAKLPLVDGFKAVVAAQYDSESVLNVMVTADLAEAKLAGPLSALLGFRIADATKAVAAYATTELFAKVGLKATDTLKITATVDTYNYTKDDQALYAKVGCDFTGISLTTISVNYDSSDLLGNQDATDSKLGKLVLTAKVAY